jgi:hypothetical protein
MEFRIISLPPFKAASSGVDKEFDFSSYGILGKFDKYFSAIKPSERDSFMARDFLFFDEEKQGMVWWWALSDDMDDGGNEVVDFEGGYYITYVYKDGDEETNGKLYNQALEYIKNSDIFELDIHQNHYAMGHIITPSEVIKVQGWAQMETFIPVKIKTTPNL